MDQEAVPGEPAVALASSQNGNIVRLDTATGNRTTVRPFPAEDEDRYRFHWLSPMGASPHSPERVYFGGNRLFLSDDLGGEWRATEDLTLREDRSELPILGVLPAEGMLSRHDGVSHWGTLTTLAESPLVPGLLYVGSDDGRLARSDDDGESWEFLEANLPVEALRATISRVTPSAHEEDRLYVAVDRHALGDFAPYVFVSENRGASFAPLGAGLPRGWVNDVVEHPLGENFLVVGSEVGAFRSFDRGRSWMRVGGLPHVPVDDIEIHPRERDLVFGTHGRSIYILDDSAPLARHDPAAAGPELFEPRPAHLFLPWKHESYEGQARYAGENPPYGALLTVFLPDAGGPVPVLEVRDAEGGVVARPAIEARAGFQRIVWNLRSGAQAAGDERESGEGSRVCGVSPPRVAAGTYEVRLEAAGESLAVPLEVRLDPSVAVSRAAYAQRAGVRRRGLRRDPAAPAAPPPRSARRRRCRSRPGKRSGNSVPRAGSGIPRRWRASAASTASSPATMSAREPSTPPPPSTVGASRASAPASKPPPPRSRAADPRRPPRERSAPRRTAGRAAPCAPAPPLPPIFRDGRAPRCRPGLPRPGCRTASPPTRVAKEDRSAVDAGPRSFRV